MLYVEYEDPEKTFLSVQSSHIHCSCLYMYVVTAKLRYLKMVTRLNRLQSGLGLCFWQMPGIMFCYDMTGVGENHELGLLCHNTKI